MKKTNTVLIASHEVSLYRVDMPRNLHLPIISVLK